MPTCSAPDCNEQVEKGTLSVGMGWYCDDVCRNVTIQALAEQLEQEDITEDLPDDRVAEIRERVEEYRDKFWE